MADSVPIDLAGEQVELLVQRALYWHQARTLVIADLHLGKADHFRRAGIALPRGGTSHDLDRLDALLDATGATRLLVLGDCLHGSLADAPWQQRWLQWRSVRAELAVDVVAGNHDRMLRQHTAKAQTLGIALHTQALQRPPFVFVHAFSDVPTGMAGYALAGHVHPILRLPGLPRLPAFALGRKRGLLPAFTQFSGGQVVRMADYERWFVCAPDALLAV